MSATALKEDNPFGFESSFAPGEKNEKDTERRGSRSRRYSRIVPVPRVAADSDSDKGDVGRQIELEADAAIKYRTCSWQKVGFLLVSYARSIVPRFHITSIRSQRDNLAWTGANMLCTTC
jgi:hypothetical protein